MDAEVLGVFGWHKTNFFRNIMADNSQISCDSSASCSSKSSPKRLNIALLILTYFLLALSIPVIVDVLVIGTLYMGHLMSYSGVCGPYATDIPVYSCDLDEYLQNFWGGFNGLGLVFLAIIIFVAVFVMFSLVYFITVLIINNIRKKKLGIA
ncbi:hypothetical protein JW887_03020 [Candidatus Dojkabacteria bacterium]|nr:hypothetical protein [Candidatus Dojkabacteria bacterium]